MARSITGQTGTINVFAGGSGQTVGIDGVAGIGEFQILKEFYSSDTFTINESMGDVTFMGFGGGGNGATGFSGGGGGFFQKTIAAPAPGTTFTLQIGGISGTTYLRDADDNIICEATGGTAATEEAHGQGGTASGGDINSNGAPGTGEGGGAAGSPFGHSRGASMYMLPEYAATYGAFTRQMAYSYGSMWEALSIGVAGSHGASRSDAAASPGGKGGFGARGGKGGDFTGTIGSAPRSGKGGQGGIGGGGGPGGDSPNISIGAYPDNAGGGGGNGGAGGGGGGGGTVMGGANPGAGGTGGTGAILVLIRPRNLLTAMHRK